MWLSLRPWRKWRRSFGTPFSYPLHKIGGTAPSLAYIYQRIEWYWRLLLRPSVSTQVLILPVQCYHHQRRLYHLIIPLALLSRPPLVVETLNIRPCRPGRHQLPLLQIYFHTSLL